MNSEEGTGKGHTQRGMARGFPAHGFFTPRRTGLKSEAPRAPLVSSIGNRQSSIANRQPPCPVSRIPNPDMYFSKSRKIMEAMGGRLDIRAVLPNGVVRINQFEEVRKPARPNPAAGK